MQSLKRWIQRQNLYLWAAALGLFGLIDALIPGPPVTRLIGVLVMVGAAWLWLDSPK